MLPDNVEKAWQKLWDLQGEACMLLAELDYHMPMSPFFSRKIHAFLSGVMDQREQILQLKWEGKPKIYTTNTTTGHTDAAPPA